MRLTPRRANTLDAFAWLPEAVPDAMAIIRANDQFQYVNAAWESLFGYREAELVGEPITALVGDCLLYTSPSPRDLSTSRMPSSA